MALPDLHKLSDPELMQTWGTVMDELRDRDIVQSGNSPIADIAETVVADQLNGKKAPPNTRGWDVKVKRRRIQVKAVRQAHRKRSQLSPIRSDDYEAVVAVVFDAHLHVMEILEIPKSAVKDCGRWSKHVNGHLLSLNKIRAHRRCKSIPVKSKWR